MKCLDKKRIKMKQGETLALNERIMLSLVSTGVSYIHQQLNQVLNYKYRLKMNALKNSNRKIICKLDFM